MASSNSDIGLNDISKMKVAELKKELKARGLSTAGSKTELIERLQSAGTQSLQDAISEDGNAESEILDEDEVLDGVEGAGEFDDEDAEAVLADEPKVKTQPVSATQKRSASLTTEASQEAQPKKRVLVRPSSITISSGKENGSQEKNTQMDIDESKPEANGKKIVKLSTVSLKERLALRAQKFGLPLSDTAKKQARAERFGAAPTAVKTVGSATKVTLIGPSEEVLKKRAERFGGNVSSTAIKVDEKDKLKRRQERFGLTSAASVDSLDEKKKLRAERFQL